MVAVVVVAAAAAPVTMALDERYFPTHSFLCIHKGIDVFDKKIYKRKGRLKMLSFSFHIGSRKSF